MPPQRFWTLLEQIGTSGAAAYDWEILLGKTWKTAPLRRTLQVAGTILDASNPDRHLELIEEDEDCYTTTFPLNSTISLARGQVEVWIPDWNLLAEELAKELGFIAIDPGSAGQTRQIGSITSRKLPARHVFLHIPGGHVGMRAALLRDMATLPACTLFLPSAALLSADVSKMADAQDIRVETIAERMAMPVSERGTLLVRARSAAKKSSAKKELLPILDVQPAWMWSNLRMVLDPTGSIAVQYGHQKGAFTFPKANGSQANRHTEILAQVAVKGCWKNPPSGTKNHERNRKAFRRLEKDLKLLIPIAGHPFDKEKGEWKPVFQLTLPEEHLRAHRERLEKEKEDD